MMRWIIGTSMKMRLVVTAIGVLLMAFGLTQIGRMPVDALPEFTRPYVEIQTEALGLSAPEVEAMITTPMEADMINGTPWAEEIRSVSVPGMSSITLVFGRETDLMRARQVVQERMTEIFALPHVSQPPTMINPVSSASRCLEIGVTSEEVSLIDLSVLARWTIAPKLMGLPGVANVSIFGERQRQLQVQVEPENLRRQGVTLMQVIKTAGNSLWASPLSYLEASTPGTGGWIDTPNQRLGVRHILPITTADDLAEVPIEGAPGKTLRDVANVIESHQPLIGDALVNDNASLMLVVEKFPWANTRDVTNEVEAALASLQHGLPGVNMDPTLFRPATFLDLAMDNFASTALISGLLLALALFAFMMNWRTALIGVAVILISAIVTVGVFYARGAELNMIVLAGLMVAMFALIDDAIGDLHNIVRRLRQTGAEGSERLTATMLYQAISEMRSPMLYALAILALAIVPLMLLDGVSGAFFQPFATTFLLAIAASMLSALILTPALSLLLLHREGALSSSESPVAKALRNIFAGLGNAASRAARPAFLTVCVLTVIGLLGAAFLRQESLLPDLKQTDLLVRMSGSASASHPAMTRIAARVGKELRGVPGVRNVSANIGRAIMSDKRSNVNDGDIWVSIDPGADYDATVAAVRGIVSGYPGLSPEVLTYTEERVREELSGTGESLVVRVYGENFDTIREKADEVRDMLAQIDGLVDPKVQYPEIRPTLEIEVDVDRAKVHGLKPGDVRRSATSLVSGIVVGSLFEEQKVFDVVVWGAPNERHSVNSIRDLLIDKPDGGQVRLADVAHVRVAPAAAKIHRDAVARRMDVTATVGNRDLAAVASDIESGINQISFPLEYRAELLGEYAERLAAQDRVMAFAIAALLGIFLLLQVFTRSWRLAAALFLTLPMALAGGVLAVYIGTGGAVTFGSIVAFFGLFGLAVRNTLTLVARYQRHESDGAGFSADSISAATREMATPIMMTAVALALVFLPFAFAGSAAGLELMHPIALVMLVGLISTTLYSLVGVPSAYLLFGAHREADLEELPVTVVGEGEVVSGMPGADDVEEVKQAVDNDRSN